MRLRFAAVTALLATLVAGSLPAQTMELRPGRIVGRVIDESGAPIAGAQVGIAASGGPNATTGTDGRFMLLNVPAGPIAIAVRAIGYAPKTVSGIDVPDGGAVEQNIVMAAQTVQVEELTVTASAERGTVAAALDEQRNATGVVNTITAEQISRSPDADAGQAVQRVSGVTVQDGRYVYVRGLGERYTTTSLNGSRIPSPEPERKVVPLDLFPSNLLEAISTSKTFTPDQPGDFSGAQVDLRTREFLLGRVWTLSVGSGFNSAVAGRTVIRAPTAGSEWLGFATGPRAMPSALRGGDLAGRSPSEISAIIASFRNAWSARPAVGGGNGSFSTSLGGERGVLGRPVNYAGSLTYSYGEEIRRGERRAVAQMGDAGSVPEQQNAYQGMTARTSTLWGGMLNLSTRLGGSRLLLNNTYTRSADNEASSLAGRYEGFDAVLDLTRLTYTERAVRSHQLRGQHMAGWRHAVDWAASYAAVNRSEPDRSDLAYLTSIDSATGTSHPTEWLGAARSATRTFSTVAEASREGALNWRIQVGDAARQTFLKSGFLARSTDRAADTRAFDVINGDLSRDERLARAESIFASYAEAGRLQLFPGAVGRYDATDRLFAGYLQLEAPLWGRARVVTGARVERSRMVVTSNTVDLGDTTSVLATTDVLPSLAVTMPLSARQTLRLSASQTLSRPEYRELSPVTYFDILGGQKLFGNLGLKRALIRNYDVRWEWYPSSGEVVSVALFAKQFVQPIERVLVQTSDASQPDATFVNANGADNYGIELELRRNLGTVLAALQPVTLFSNVTLMRSDIRPGNDSLSSLTNASRPMVGQSPYVVNAGLAYARRAGGFSATVLFNRSGRRIVEAGVLPLPDSYEEARSLLDANVQLPLWNRTTLKLDALNLLDAPHRMTQGGIERLWYRSGRTFGMGLTWSL